ncbi:MAG: HNH endonuclease [Hyphomicrobiaceae bacterium]
MMQVTHPQVFEHAKLNLWINQQSHSILSIMKRPENLVERSFSMMIASYYLARCGEPVENGSANPPKALEAPTWNAAYDFFYDAMGDGRTPSQFRNSMKNARDTFDTLFDNGRIGWVDRDGQQPSLSVSFRRVHDEWKDRSDKELEEFVLGLQSGMPTTKGDWDSSTFVRTEGGEKVYVSVRRERDPKLREQAIAIHGSDCMACGFNFQRMYGSVGQGFIEVHHATPLSESGLTGTDPRTDLVVLRANCHRIVHRRKGMCLSLDELRRHLKVASDKA